MIVRAFVSGPEREALLAKALAHMSRGELAPNASGPGRYFAKADEAPGVYVDPLLAALTHRCERCLRTAGMAFDGGLGRIISLIMPGGFIHRHRDAYHEGVPGHRPGSEHLRCNIVVSFPHPSAAPVIDGEALQLDEARAAHSRPYAPALSAAHHMPGPRPPRAPTNLALRTQGDLWAFFASRCDHQTEPLAGTAPRVVYGFGWAVPTDHVIRAPPDDWRDDSYERLENRRVRT